MPFAGCGARGETPLRVEREEVPLGEGFERVIVARENAPRKPIAGLEVIAVSRVDAAVKVAFA